jgi:GTPase Era involved in 16S rRNA processing
VNKLGKNSGEFFEVRIRSVQKKGGFTAQTSTVTEFFRERFSRFAGQFLPHEIRVGVGGIKKNTKLSSFWC